MRQARVIRSTDQRVVANPCDVADDFFSRFQGLMGKRGLTPGAGLLIEPCNSIHTFFMRFDIDVLYLGAAERSDNYKVLAIRRAMRPWRVDFPVFGARAVLEIASGAAQDLAEGDLLCLS